MSIDYTQSIENLFESINVIVSRKLEDVSFDTTIVCTVVDDIDRKNGKYQVTNGTIKFDAYTDSSDYRTGDSVRVQVLNGDYSDKKYIVGKAVTNTDTTPLTYVSPIDTIVNITGNLIDDKGSITGLIANGNETFINLWGADLSEHEIWTDGIYSALTVRADFRTLLDNYDLKAGSYGLRVHLFIKPSKESSYYVDNYFDLDSSEMFGNPYAFTVYTKQGKKVALTTSGIVQHIVLSAYQKADFVNRSGNAINAAQKENIFIKNIEIGFGSDLEKIDDNTVKIYTNSNTQYKYYQHTEETNLKTLGLLWYNKNDNNEYLGFSDGYYDPDYDELTYIAESAEDARRGAYMARDGMPSDIESLDLAANIDDAIPIFQAARKLVTGDLVTQLRSFENQLNGAADAASLLTNYTKTGDSNVLTTAANNIKKDEESLKKMYSMILAYWHIKSQGKIGTEPTDIDNYASEILLQYKKIIEDIKTLISNIRKTAAYGYQGVCDNYEARINRVLNKIEDTLNTLPLGILDGTDYPILEKWGDKTNFKSYQRKDFSSYDNKYCVYWYRANKEAEADGIMPADWERIENLDNFGIPGKGEKVDGKFHNQTKLPAGENTTEYYMQHDLVKETFKAVVFYNHDKFISDELEFTNADDIPDKLILDKSDALVIKHKSNSRNNYNCYAMTNYLLNAADSSIEREIECYYDGLLAKNEALINARAYWYVPKDSTMVMVNSNLLAKKGFVVDESRPKQGYVCYYKKIIADTIEKEDKTKEYNFGESLSFWYRIKPYYEQSAALNDIQCEVILANENDEDYIASQLTLTFGQQSTSGTKYTMVIAPSTIQRGTTPSDNYLMSLHLEDAEGERVPLSTEGLPDSANEVAYGLAVTPVMSRVVTGTKAAPSLFNEGNLAEAEYWMLTASQNNYGIYKVSASIGINTTQKDENNEEKVVKTRYVDLIAWFNVPWSAGKNGDDGYYLSGPTSIIYNNLGTLDNTIAYQVPYKLFNDNNEQVNVAWNLEYHKIDGKTENSKDIDLRYMPSLNADNTLSPASMYLNGLEYYPVLVAKQGDNVLWRQPIIIMQNQYASNMLNDWDGSFQIDEKNGTIMSSMIAAGRKNSNNTFEGVVMGCVAQNLEIDELNDSADGVGIYGFHDGAASFGVLVDGTAFMGKAGNGRILINGNKGTIENAAYSQTKIRKNENGEKIYSNPAGMQIDLEKGKLTMRSASLGGDNTWYAAGVGETNDLTLETCPSVYAATITMDATIDQDSYLDINVPYWNGTKWNLKSLIHIGDKIDGNNKIIHSYYLQSQNYKTGTYNWKDSEAHSETGAGTFFNLVEGTIDAYNFKLQSKNVLIDSSEKANPYFVVKSDADLEDSEGNSIGNRNLIYCGKGLYYLQSSDYQKGIAGTNIDLTLGKISSYNFELSAGTANTGLIEIKSAPKDGEYYLNVQKGDNAYIRLSKEGVLSLKASTFTLVANNTYFSSSAATYTINGSSRNVVLRMGDNFGVSADGHLYCANANISGSITATTLSTINGYIGGWKITKDTLQNEAGSVKLNSSLGSITGATISGGSLDIGNGACKIDSDGKLTATGAVLTTLTVNRSLTVAKDGSTGNVSIAGNCTIDGTCTIGSGDTVVYIGKMSGTGGNDGLMVRGGHTALYTTSVWLGNGGSTDRVVANADLTVNRDITYAGNIYCGEHGDASCQGQDLDTCYLMSTIGGGVLMKFKKGILVSMEKKGVVNTSFSSDDGIPGLTGQNGKFLQVHPKENKMQWISIYPPTSRGMAVNQVWASNGTNEDPAWKTIGATLVNFTEGTATITKKTSGSTTYYTVEAKKEISFSKKTDYVANTYLCWNEASATSQRVTTYETTSISTAQTYDHYTTLSLSARAYTYYDVPSATQTVSTEANVVINLSLT